MTADRLDLPSHDQSRLHLPGAVRVREVGQALFDALVVCWNGDCDEPSQQAKTSAALHAWKYDICGGHPPDPSGSDESGT